MNVTMEIVGVSGSQGRKPPKKGAMPSYTYYSRSLRYDTQRHSLTAEGDLLRAVNELMPDRVTWCPPGVLLLQ
jgi:hypothetical protein